MLLAALVYLATMPPALYWGDGIELTTAAYTLGVPHPTGYPLYMLLGKLFTLIPINDVAWRMHLSSVVFMLGAASGFFFVIRTLASEMFSPQHFPSRHYAATISIAFMLIFAFSRTVWRLGAVAEVYALHVVFLVLIMYLSLLSVTKRSRTYAFLAVFVFCLAMTHHLMILTTLPFVAIAIGRRAVWFRSFKATIGTLVLIVAMILLAGAVYLYLPLRAAHQPPVNWGNPSTVENFMWVIRGGEFRDFYFLNYPAGIPLRGERIVPYVMMRLRQMSQWASTEFFDLSLFGRTARYGYLLIIMCMAIGGLVYLVKRQRSFGLALILHLVLGISVIFLYGIYDIEDYFVSLVPGMLVALFAGITRLQNKLERRLFKRKVHYVNWLYFLIPLIMLTQHYDANDRHDDLTALHYGVRLFKAVPKNAIVVTLGDSDIYPLWYLQHVEQVREDVLVVGGNFIYSPWYRSFFSEQYLDGRDITIQKRPVSTEASFYKDLNRWIIEPNAGSYPIFITKSSPFLEQWYTLEPAAMLLTPEEYDTTDYQFLPSPYLFRILPPGK